MLARRCSFFAVVLGVTQVALGLMIILQSLSRIGVFTLRV